uniref:Nidogen 2 n=1 Tax=Coturnix japonica TaxID=93934 RepID=A0A8C2TH29_COTJA
MEARPRFEPAPPRPVPPRRLRSVPSGPLGSVALRGMRAVRALLAVAAVAAAVAALPRSELLPYGAAHGDGRLRHGDDESSPGVLLRPPMRLYGRVARRLFVGTNGVISSQDFPGETQYVDDDFPTDFPVIAPFLADLDTSGGAVHRLNGKVSGSLVVGQTPVRFQDVDLHAYIVGSDGRAYTAISGVPMPAARALLPLLPLGGLFGWLFALEEPGSENGFSITGAEFTQYLEVTFYPGEEQVRITQTAEGLGADNYLSLRTHIEGQVPFVPENSSVHIAPYKELYHYSSSAVTSSAHHNYVLTSGSTNQTLSYRLHQNITVTGCPHARSRLPSIQQLSVARAFALYDGTEQVLRYALTSRISDAEVPLVNPCHDGTHACEETARCQPGTGLGYTCECAAGYRGDGRGCQDVDECEEGLSQCGPFSVCLNVPGSYRCECHSGYQPAADGHGCVLLTPAADPCEAGRHPCAPRDRARCLPRAGGQPACECLPGYAGDGRVCSDVDECTLNLCHPAAVCYNTPGSFSCQCQPGYEGDGFQCTHGSSQQLTPCEHERLYPRAVPPGPSPVGNGHVPQCDEQGNYRPLQCHGSTGHCWCVDSSGQEIAGTRTAPGSTPPRCGNPEPSERPPTMCERWRQSLLEHYGGSPRGDQYVPQCDAQGHFTPLQCHGDSGYCWCVDESGREIQGTRSEPGSSPPPCLPSIAPPSIQPSPRPDVSPPAAGTFLLYAQGQQIGYLPLNGTRLQKEAAKTLLSLHGSIVVGIDYDCREKAIYWTDVAGRTISRVSLEPGAEPETIINSGLISPEGLAVDHLRRAMFWTDSGLDKIERAQLDGSERRVLFDTDLVNPRAITVDPVRGNLYWTDWNREAPKIETSTVSGANRRVLVNKDIGLPNGLTFDPFSKLLCWADAGTKKLECTFPDGAGRRIIHNNLNYPFSIISYASHFYHTDWRRDGVIAVNKETGSFTDEYLPEHRSHLYGITAVYPYCPGGKTQESPTPFSCLLDGRQAKEINFSPQQGNSNDNFTPKRTSDPENYRCIQGRGKPFTKANEATFRPAKDYVVLKLYLRSLLLYYFFFKVRSNDTRRNGPVNLKAIPLNSCLRKQISSVVF